MTESLGTLMVTGSGRGIGAAVARLAASEGYSVAVNCHFDAAAANALVRGTVQTGGHAAAIQADIGKKSEILRLFESADKTLPPLVALVNNAGITGGFARVDSVQASMLERLMTVGYHWRFSRGP